VSITSLHAVLVFENFSAVPQLLFIFFRVMVELGDLNDFLAFTEVLRVCCDELRCNLVFLEIFILGEK